jgi:hypothetical protein
MNKISLLTCVISLTAASLVICSDEKKKNDVSAIVKAVANINQNNTRPTAPQAVPQNQLHEQPESYYCKDCGKTMTNPPYCDNRYCC